MSTKDLMLKLRTEELNLKTEELKQTSNSLLTSNDALKSKTEELAKVHADLFESNHGLASVNKELAITNKRFAETNRMFAQVIEELSAANKELARVNNELASANEQIKSRQEITKEFINIAAHELRTPTQAIMGYSELLQILIEEDEGEEEQIIGNNNPNISSTVKGLDEQKKKALEAIFRNATRLDRLEKQILDITKIESNTLTLGKERFNLTEKIRDTVADFIANEMRRDSGYDKNNIKIEFETETGAERGGAVEKDIFIDADKTRVYQVIANLLRNAIKFASKGGVITITTDVITKQADADGTVGGGERGQVVIVKIKDNGTGIAANILPKLFTKFATTSSEGLGLGLYVSKKIVEAHGGRIWAENNPDGKGATFAFSLPAL
ncbi:MAG: ATP-binding protein [Nitrososphaeraceae archaeon]